MSRSTKPMKSQMLAALVIVTAVLWGVSALVLYIFVKPLASLNGGRSLEFDPVALAYAASIIVAAAILSWLPVFLLARKRPPVLLAVLTSVSTLALLGALFLLVENVMGSSWLGGGIWGRAGLILADGNGMAFLPVVDPLISISSGIAYTAVLWLSIRLSRKKGVDDSPQVGGGAGATSPM
jgi:hypothetical protein